MTRRKAPLLAALVLFLAGSALLVFKTAPAPAPGQAPAPGATATTARPESASPSRAAVAAADAPGLESRRGPVRQAEDLVSYLRERYGKHIRDPYMQMKLLEDLMRHFQKLNPSGWEADLLAALREAFPELYDELAARLRQWSEYTRWMRENQPELRSKEDAKAARAAVWEERHRVFGKEVAEQIWRGELRNQAVADALEVIDASPGVSVEGRLSRFKESLEEVYGENSQAYVAQHQSELMNRFLDLSSVQKDLGALAPEKRTESLRHIRQEMGLDEEALARWDELDARRDARWVTGSEYMSEREAVAQQYTGPELEARLTELRARYFGDEAPTIAEEEANGFFRYTRPRVWGRN